jgi:hypothetical protein
MALTGRFNLRKTLTGRIVLQVEEEVKSAWSWLTGNARMHRRWRDANVMDLAAPELRNLVDLRFRPRYMPQPHEPVRDEPKASGHLESVAHPGLHYGAVPEPGQLPTAH